MAEKSPEITFEIWQAIDGHPDYKVSNFGRVMSFRLYKYGVIMTPTPRNANSYLSILLTHQKRSSKHYQLHRLIAIAFIPNPENKPFINHKNGIKTDNRIENLEWCTKSENVLHAFRTGLKKPTRGIQYNRSTLTEEQVRVMKRTNWGLFNLIEIGLIFHVSKYTVGKIINGKNWRHIQ